MDNQTIYDEVIKELKKIKGNMQFIFATHNANIPVLGDSEKIISCKYDEKKIFMRFKTWYGLNLYCAANETRSNS